MKMKLLNLWLLLVFSLFVFTQSLQENDGDDGNSDESAEPAVVLLFLFFGIIVGVLITQFLSIFGEAIPYTVLVFLAGMLFSTASGKSNTFGQSVDQWVEIDAELLLYVFLPPLIFGEAMSLNWYHLKVAFAQSVILAGPGVLIGAALMGVMTKFILPYNWNWNLLMTFGAVLSATDTVAVLSLLKSVGASPKLTILIVGESLLNDGSAIVLFTIFFNALKGTTYTASAIIGFSFAASIGSLALGIVSGLIVVRWLRSANRPLKETDVTMQIAMTISSAYIIFFVAEFSLDISGVLACCGAGAMVAWLGPPIILNHESMHNVWGMAEWTLNTLIFLLAGLIIGHRVLEKVVAIDWLYMFILYAVLMAIRGVTVFILYPFVSSIGHRCTWLEAVFMSWTGLRGAVGMALALIVEKSGPEDLDAETKRLFFYVGGIATLSLVINGTTAKSLLYSLGLLTTNSAEKILVTNQIKKKLQRKMDKVVTHMTKEFAFTDQDLEEVRLSCTLLQDINMDALYRDTERASALLADTIRDHQIQDRTHVIIQDRVLAYENDHDYDDVDDDDDDDDDDESDRRKSRNSKNPLHNKSAASERSQASPKSKLPSRSQMSHMSRVLSSVGLNPEAINSHNTQTRLHRISRFLSMGARGSSPVLEYDLLMYIRSIFLEIVRVKYWHFIEIGKLPRLSFASQFLLYSIEVGLDEVNTKNTKELDIDNRYVKDWLCIEHFINDPLPITNLLMFLERKLPRICAGNSITDALAFLEIRREKRSVYVLQAFIEAHEHAQSKIHSFLGVEEENDDEDNEEHENENEEHGVPLEARKKEKSVKSERSKVANRTPEEVKVIDESKQAVDKAKKLLSEMDAQTVAGIRSKQAARMVLAKEAEMVRSLVEEGLLTPKHAEEFLEEINTDTTRIEKERNQLYREQARRRKQQRKANLWDEWNGSDPLIHAK